MTFIKRVANFILFSSIFIACCAVAFCMETNILLGLPLSSVNFYIFVFAATITQYNFHYLIKTTAALGSDRLQWSMHNRISHFIFLVGGIVLLIYSVFSFHFYHFFVLLCLGIISFLYSFPFLPFEKRKRIKDFGVLKITTLALLWTLITVWFPINGLNYDTGLFIFIFIKRFVFMFILCLLFDMRDIEVDSTEEIKTLAVVLGKKKSYRLAYWLLLVFILLAFAQYLYLPQLGFLLAMLASAVATSMIIEFTRKNNSDFIYLAGIDGMMLLQAILVYGFSLKL
jgi:4-hydroxybenzoate polyprenyltransferase